jgi:hypothetical protein
MTDIISALSELAKGNMAQIASSVGGLIKLAYRKYRKRWGKKKADALLSKIYREILQINPDRYIAEANLLEYESLVGKKNVDFLKATALVKNIKGGFFACARLGSRTGIGKSVVVRRLRLTKLGASKISAKMKKNIQKTQESKGKGKNKGFVCEF